MLLATESSNTYSYYPQVTAPLPLDDGGNGPRRGHVRRGGVLKGGVLSDLDHGGGRGGLVPSLICIRNRNMQSGEVMECSYAFCI